MAVGQKAFSMPLASQADISSSIDTSSATSSPSSASSPSPFPSSPLPITLPAILNITSPLPIAPNSTSPTHPSNSTDTHNGHGGSAQDDHPPVVHAPRYHYYASRYSQLWILGALLLLVLMHLVRMVKHSRRERASLRKEVVGYKAVSVDEDGPDTAGERGEGPERAGWATRNARAIGAGWRNVMYLRTFPGWLYMPETFADCFWTVLYTGVYGFFTLRKCESWFPARGVDNVANQMGVMSFSQLPIILLLVSKNNPISSLTGITYQKLNYLHRASSRVSLFTSWLHVFLWTPRVWRARDTRPYLLWGIAAITGFTMLWLTSFRIVRRIGYEFFIVSHIIFSLMYLIGAFYHWTYLHYWVWPALLFWGIDRSIRGFKVLYQNDIFARLSPFRRKEPRQPLGDCRVELLDHDVMRVTVRRDRWSWKAGQHAFISSPGVSGLPHETHPFSIANVPTDESNDAVFLIRVHSGFTKRLRLALPSDDTTSVPLYIEGPYGYPHSLDSFSTVLLVAGGTGVTFTSGHFLQIIQNARRAQRGKRSKGSCVKRLHLVWHVRHAEDVEWIAGLLNQAAEMVFGRPRQRVHRSAKGKGVSGEEEVKRGSEESEEARDVRFSIGGSSEGRDSGEGSSGGQSAEYGSPTNTHATDNTDDTAVDPDADPSHPGPRRSSYASPDTFPSTLAETLNEPDLDDVEEEEEGEEGEERPLAMDVQISIYVTKSHASDEPLPPGGMLDRLAEITAPGLLRNENGGGAWDEGCRTCGPGTPVGETVPGTPVGDGPGLVRNAVMGRLAGLRGTSGYFPRGGQGQGEAGWRRGEVGRFGLTGEAAELIVWKKGRADLHSVVEADVRASEGPMNVSVCGPVQLLHSAKKAVRTVSTMKTTREGLPTIDFFEETLGA
ncbi:hypothetical protein IAT38_002721 [Cryptococcus sp. DSM 104549]